jgi:hypothetical protein
MNPCCKGRVKVTSPRGSSGANRRQRRPVHDAVALGGTGVVKASNRSVITNAVGSGAAGVCDTDAAGETTATDAGGTDVAEGMPHGFATARPTKPTSNTMTTMATRRSRPPAPTVVPWNDGPLIRITPPRAEDP